MYHQASLPATPLPHVPATVMASAKHRPPTSSSKSNVWTSHRRPRRRL